MQSEIIEDKLKVEEYDVRKHIDVHVCAVGDDDNGGIEYKVSGGSLDNRTNTVRIAIAILTSTIYKEVMPDDMHFYTDVFQQGIMDGLSITAYERQMQQKARQARKEQYEREHAPNQTEPAIE